jgi:uncharacterized protein YdeI (YjbR/CyaY-like superfamily)
MSTRKPELPIILFASRNARAAWLEEPDATSEELWLKPTKKGSGIDTVSFVEALEVALCYGWTDSQSAGFDDRFWLLRLTPRWPKSKWSKGNRGKMMRLIEEGRMSPAGMREVERAKADGRWEA